MLLIGFILHYIIAVVIFAIIAVGLELDINIFFGGFILLVGFYAYRIITAKERYRKSKNNPIINEGITALPNEKNDIVNIIADKNFPFVVKSDINKKLLSHFENSENKIITSELGILNLFFIRLCFLEFFQKIEYKYDEKLLDFINDYYIEKYFILSDGKESLEKIEKRLEYYSQNLKYGMGMVGIGYSIFEKLTQKSMLIPSSQELSYIESYIFTQLEISEGLSDGLLKRNKLTNIFSAKKDSSPLKNDVLDKAKNILDGADKIYVPEMESLQKNLLNELLKLLSRTSTKKLEEIFGNKNDNEINIVLYNNFLELIVNNLEIENIHSPLGKFEYYTFLLNYFADELKEIGELNEEDIENYFSGLQIDGGGGYTNMLHEREKYLKDYKNYTDIKDDDETEQELDFNDEKKDANEPDVDENRNLAFYEEHGISDEIDKLEKLIEQEKYIEAIRLQDSFNEDFKEYLKDNEGDVFYIKDYYLYVGIAYQETGDVKQADKFFKKYINTFVLFDNDIDACEEEGIYHIKDMRLNCFIKNLKDSYSLKYKGNIAYKLYKK